MESHSPFYEVIRCIASGTFGVVFEARDTSNKRVAIKRQEKSLPRDRNMQLLPMPPSQEHLALLELKGCEHVVEMLDFFHTKMEEKLIQNIVMEFIPRNLTNLIMRFNCNVPEPIIKRVAFQIFKGLTQVHEKGVGFIHRDIKPENILITDDLVTKLADFGVARKPFPDEKLLPCFGTSGYKAPELLLGTHDYTSAIDVWAAGCILVELHTGFRLFQAQTEADELISMVMLLGPIPHTAFSFFSGSLPPFPDILPLLDQIPFHFPSRTNIGELVRGSTDLVNLLDLLSSIFQYDYSVRITAKAALSHPYFQNLPPLE